MILMLGTCDWQRELLSQNQTQKANSESRATLYRVPKISINNFYMVFRKISERKTRISNVKITS